MFPEILADKPTGYIPPSVMTGTNADLIAAIAPLYLEGRHVVDATYGLGGWWKRYQPESFTAHDINPAKGDGVDFRNLPEPDGSAGAVCFDPPYVPAGAGRSSGRTVAEARFTASFGIGYEDAWAPRGRGQLVAIITAGVAECGRILAPDGYLLAKCTDYVDGGVFRLGHLDMIDAARSAGLGDPWDLIIHHAGSGPGGHNIWTAKRARRHHSYLLVWRKP